jgi:hypothetical protein
VNDGAMRYKRLNVLKFCHSPFKRQSKKTRVEAMDVEKFVEEAKKGLSAIETLLKNAWQDECLNEEKLETAVTQVQNLVNDFDVTRSETKPPLTVSMKVCVGGVVISAMILYHFYWNFFVIVYQAQ